MSDTAVAEPAAPEAPAAPTPAKADTPEDIKKRARKPPKDGPCKRCGQDRPLNRLMLCYKCWVITNLEHGGWKQGEPHPADCGCEGLGEHRAQDGTSRGMN